MVHDFHTDGTSFGFPSFGSGHVVTNLVDIGSRILFADLIRRSFSGRQERGRGSGRRTGCRGRTFELADNGKVKVSKPLVGFPRVFKGKDIQFSTRDEFTLFIDLFHLGVSNDVDLDFFQSRNTLNVQIDLERNLGFTLPVTSKILEFSSIGSTGSLLGQQVESRSISIIGSDPELRSEQGPILVGFKGNFQISFFIDFDTDLSGLHGLLRSTGNNGVTFLFDGRDNFVGPLTVRTDFGLLGRNGTTVAVDLEIEPSHPGLSVSHGMIVGECLFDGGTNGFSVFIGGFDFGKGDHGVLDKGFRNAKTEIDFDIQFPRIDSSGIAHEILKGFVIDRTVSEHGNGRNIAVVPEFGGDEFPFSLCFKGDPQFGIAFGSFDQFDTNFGNILKWIFVSLSIQKVAEFPGIVRGSNADIGWDFSTSTSEMHIEPSEFIVSSFHGKGMKSLLLRDIGFVLVDDFGKGNKLKGSRRTEIDIEINGVAPRGETSTVTDKILKPVEIDTSVIVSWEIDDGVTKPESTRNEFEFGGGFKGDL